MDVLHYKYILNIYFLQVVFAHYLIPLPSYLFYFDNCYCINLHLVYFVHMKKDHEVIDYFQETLFDYPLYLKLMMDEFLNG